MMLQRHTRSNVPFYASPALLAAGVAHGFSTRLGGISPPPFDSMNLGNPQGCDIQDDYDRIGTNYERLQAAIGCQGRALCRVHQVHGAAVAVAETGRPFDRHAQADAIVTRDPGKVSSVRVADCVPILLASRDGRTVAAVHSGWRGVIANVVAAAVDAMRRCDPGLSGGRDLLAAIGPCIGYDAFEVGPEVAAAFRQTFGPRAPVRDAPDGKARVDLREAVRLQLLDAAVAIDATDRCTYRDRDEFFSHRRDHGVTGRMAALISPRA